MPRKQIELSNEVAAELAGPGDLIMRTLEEHLDCGVFLRGNLLTLDGSDPDVEMGETVVRELSDEQLGAIVGDAVAESGASSPKEMGKVMALVMPQVKGRADGKRVSAAVKEKLTP